MSKLLPRRHWVQNMFITNVISNNDLEAKPRSDLAASITHRGPFFASHTPVDSPGGRYRLVPNAHEKPSHMDVKEEKPTRTYTRLVFSHLAYVDPEPSPSNSSFSNVYTVHRRKIVPYRIYDDDGFYTRVSRTRGLDF